MPKPNLVRVASDTWVNEGEIVSICVESYTTGKAWRIRLKGDSNIIVPFESDPYLRLYLGIGSDA